jgi:hypothetical protein
MTRGPGPAYLRIDKARLLTRLGIGLYLILSAVYLWLGQANADEGWYLYAAKLVFQGELPYRDFAYTQMPLLPYTYGVIQILHSSLFLGRLTSVLLSIGTLGLGIIIARRYAGARGGAITALFSGAFTFCVYSNSIVKTYALVSFCFAATLFVLSSDMSDTWKYLLGLMYAYAAALVRVTALFFALSILVYVLIAASRRTRVMALLETAAAGLVAGFFVLPDWPVARWNLFSSHLSHWGSSPVFDRAKEVLTVRLPDIAQSYGPMLVLGAGALYLVLGRKDMKSWPRDAAPLAVVAVGAVLFAGSHLANGIWQVEYLVPAAAVLVPVVAIVVSRLYGEARSVSRAFIQGALIAAVLMLPLGESTQHTDLTGGRAPLAEIDQVANFVERNTGPTDRVLALEALDVVVDAGRSALPGMTMAQFSFQDVDTATAQRLHVVNYQMVTEAINQKAASLVLLTDADLRMLGSANPADPEALPRALEENYRQAMVMTQFGQYSQTLTVYSSR